MSEVERDGHARQCAAKTSSGVRCRAFAIRGGMVCRAHGGSAPQAKAKAKQRLAAHAAQADAQRLLAHEAAAARLDDPLEALSQVTVEAIALKNALAARVNALKEMRYAAPGAGTEQLRAEIAAYERSLDRVARFADMLAKHGWEERRVELAEATGRLLAGVVRAVLDRLLLSDGQRELAATVVPEEFRHVAALEAGTAAASAAADSFDAAVMRLTREQADIVVNAFSGAIEPLRLGPLQWDDVVDRFLLRLGPGLPAEPDSAAERGGGGRA